MINLFQAIEGRQSKLELSEKVNTFQSRLKAITRFMMSTIAELSMLQATIIKLQHEREDLEKIHTESGERLEQGLPPRPESEIKYFNKVIIKILVLINKYQIKYDRIKERELRRQKEELERNMPSFATKSTAEHRFHSYMPDVARCISKTVEDFRKNHFKKDTIVDSDETLKIFIFLCIHSKAPFLV